MTTGPVTKRASGAAWVGLAPALRPADRAAFARYAAALAAIGGRQEERHGAIEAACRGFFAEMNGALQRGRGAALVAAVQVATDLARHGWRFRARGDGAEVARPDAAADPLEEKRRVRAQHEVERREQLLQPPVRQFVTSMERRRVFGDRFVSIFNLMRDGRDLAEALRRARAAAEPAAALAAVIQPYLQFVEDETSTCAHTGLRLMDVWRYFRHTWASAYKSVPGRSMLVLVRDAAADCHPVIGIAALSSAAVQISVRDRWLGWSSKEFIAEHQARPTVKVARWLQRVVDGAIDEVYKVDLLADGLLTSKALRAPSDEVIARLAEVAAAAREQHHRLASARDMKRDAPGAFGADDDAAGDLDDAAPARGSWEARAREPLFVSKRADGLARLLRARRCLRRHFGAKPTAAGLRALLDDPEGRRVAAQVLRKAKADRVGIVMADISICGAVPPYGAVLGGKLVAMLLASAEVVDAYRRRYRRAASVIASSMAGREVIRPPHLALLGTTSLYGVGSSQYNRVAIPCERAGGRAGEVIRYEELGMTEGFGTFQFGDEAVSALTRLVQQSEGGQRVNSIFGEGVNPRLRKIRDGLDALDLAADHLLNHGSPRRVYGIPLVRNLRGFVLGLDERPDYLLPARDAQAVTAGIVAWWRERWLARRITQDEVLAAVAEHTRVQPIRHGARVALPLEDPEQRRFFAE